jgi:hypothetical protein
MRRVGVGQLELVGPSRQIIGAAIDTLEWIAAPKGVIPPRGDTWTKIASPSGASPTRRLRRRAWTRGVSHRPPVAMSQPPQPVPAPGRVRALLGRDRRRAPEVVGTGVGSRALSALSSASANLRCSGTRRVRMPGGILVIWGGPKGRNFERKAFSTVSQAAFDIWLCISLKCKFCFTTLRAGQFEDASPRGRRSRNAQCHHRPSQACVQGPGDRRVRHR